MDGSPGWGDELLFKNCEKGYAGAMTGKWIKGFDGLRAIAVGIVVFSHKTTLGGAMHPGGYGVHLFFVLSGFLIVGILYGSRERLVAGASNFATEIGHFYENRLFRIWPIYFLTVAIVWLASVTGQSAPMYPGQLFGLLTFTTNLFQAHVWPSFPPKAGAMWSIAVEEQFYLWIAPVALLAPRRYYSIIFSAVIVIALVAAYAFARTPGYSLAINAGSLTNFGLMAIGGLAVIKGGRHAWYARAAPYALGLFLVLPVVAWAAHFPGWLEIVAAYSIGPVVAVLLLGIVTDQNSWLVWMLELPPVRYIGKISYGIYIYHGMVTLKQVNALRPYLRGDTSTGLIETALAIGLAALSWTYIEKPLLGLRDRNRLRRREARALAVAPALESVVRYRS